MTRRVADCRDFPSETGCTLTIAGEEAEVLQAAMDHAVSVHGHERTPELEGEIRTMLKDESPPAMAQAPQASQAAQQETAPRH